MADARFDEAVQRLFARRPERMVPGLERISALCARLGDPQRCAPAVHVTGTNGKTTLARMVSTLLSAHGHEPGTYTSPHLQDVTERVRIGGRRMRRDEFVRGLDTLLEHVDAVEAERGEMVTFFETLTALAFQHFAARRVSAAVVEVGMGGRWDATNVLDAEVAVLNPVRLDHAELGDAVEQVAWEKAGIISQGGVCVTAEQWPAAHAVIAAEARERDAQLLVAGTDFALLDRRMHEGGQTLVIGDRAGTVDAIELPLHGAHQADNAAVALAATSALLGDVDPDAVRAGFSAVRSPGRMEIVPGAVPVLLDGAHNPAGAQALARALTEELPAKRRVVVLGAMGDKDYGGIIEALAPIADAFVCTEAPTLRSASAEQLAKVARIAGVPTEVEAEVDAAITRARGLAGEGTMVVVTGSLYLVGAARDALGPTPA